MPLVDCTNCTSGLNAASKQSYVRHEVAVDGGEKPSERGNTHELVCECFRDSHSPKGFAFKKHTHPYAHTRTQHSEAPGRLQMERSETHCPDVPACSGLPVERGASGHTHAHTYM